MKQNNLQNRYKEKVVGTEASKQNLQIIFIILLDVKFTSNSQLSMALYCFHSKYNMSAIYRILSRKNLLAYLKTIKQGQSFQLLLIQRSLQNIQEQSLTIMSTEYVNLQEFRYKILSCDELINKYIIFIKVTHQIR
ncbi:hypothetical protein pb186bvf_014313 [Paramecium bursaria]